MAGREREVTRATPTASFVFSKLHKPDERWSKVYRVKAHEPLFEIHTDAIFFWCKCTWKSTQVTRTLTT